MIASTNGFALSPISVRTSTELGASHEKESSSRRSFVSSVISSGVAAVGGLSLNTFFPNVANALTGEKKVNAKLKAFGLPPQPKVDGLTPLVEIYGKGSNRFPLLVTFSYPLTWILTLPSNDKNGEDGTIQAGEYAKGDTATLYVYEEPGHVNDIAKQPKELFETALQKCISLKGSNQYQNFKVTKLEPSPDDPNYMLADFKYQLLTGAGFEVDRKGVASITSEGKAVEVLWAASTTQRWKKTESTLRDIVKTFRCYADGINLSDEIITFENYN